MGLLVDPQAHAAIMAHARQCAAMTPPEEAAGVIANGRYIACPNRAADRRRGFRIAHEDMKRIGSIEAVVHSHPGGPAYPSHHDMSQQSASGMPWVVSVVATATSPDTGEDLFVFGTTPKLDLRAGYRHGVDDCYGLIRGWFRSCTEITLPDYPRDWEWWANGNDLYQGHFAEAGFRPVIDTHPRRGDVFLAAVRSPVPNHAGVYLGDGLILHHLAGREPVAMHRLPVKEPVERWRKFITTWLRHERAKCA